MPAPKTLPAHGTRARYQLHLRNGEDPDEACRAANAAYASARRAPTDWTPLYAVGDEAGDPVARWRPGQRGPELQMLRTGTFTVQALGPSPVVMEYFGA